VVSRFDKLNDKNYHTWKQKIELLLAFRDFDEVVFGDPPPDMATDEEVAYAFKRLDAKAKAVIGLTLSDEHLEHVRDAQTAADMWKCLMNVFQRCSLLNKLAMRRRFYAVSMEGDEYMLGYINRVRHIADELKSMGCVVGDEEVVMAILNGLPSEYDHLIVALDAMGGDGETKLTLDVTKSRLLQGEQRKSERCGPESLPEDIITSYCRTHLGAMGLWKACVESCCAASKYCAWNLSFHSKLGLLCCQRFNQG
jgi:hypothetical protein